MTLRITVALLFVQAAALAVLLGFLVVAIGQREPGRVVSALLLPFEVLALLIILALVALGWQLRRLRGWARGPVVALELLFVPLTYYLIGLGVVGVLIIASAVTCVALLIAPASRAALGIRP